MNLEKASLLLTGSACVFAASVALCVGLLWGFTAGERDALARLIAKPSEICSVAAKARK